MFKKIEAAIKREVKDYLNNSIKVIRNGNEYDTDAGIRRYLTATMWTKYTAGAITRKEAITKATARAVAKYDKELNKDLARLEAYEHAGRLESVNITVDWKKSRVWGYNPTATAAIVWIDEAGNHRSGVYYGHASGCGYDKRSAAVADALNQCDAVRGMLCAYANKHYNKDIRTGGRAICYGCGYTSIPYFEGGVGVSCFREAFELCGYTWNGNEGAKYADFYHIVKRHK